MGTDEQVLPPTELSPSEAKGKLQRAIQRLGISFLSLSRIIQYDENAGTAYWSCNPATGEESVHIGPTIIALELPEIEMVLRHEFLHRASYNGFNERYHDSELTNIVEDVCIHRLLYESYPDALCSLSEKIYPSEEKANIISLANCNADPEKIPEQWRDLWRYIWEQDEYGNYSEINPASLYYRLVDLKERGIIEFVLPLPVFSGKDGFSGKIPDLLKKPLGEILSSMPVGGSSQIGGSTGKMMAEYIGIPNPFGEQRLLDFLSRLKIDMIMTNITDKVKMQYRYSVNEFYPMYPTRLGMIYMTTGLSDGLHMFNNQYTETKGKQLSLVMYIDVSGSMEENYGLVYHFVKAVVDIPLEVRIFSDQVTDIGAEGFRKGKFHTGGGTNFNNVLKDLSETENVEGGVMFTDGQADVDASFGDTLRDSGKLLYLVYFTREEREVLSGSLNQYAEDFIVFPPANSLS